MVDNEFSTGVRLFATRKSNTYVLHSQYGEVLLDGLKFASGEGDEFAYYSGGHGEFYIVNNRAEVIRHVSNIDTYSEIREGLLTYQNLETGLKGALAIDGNDVPAKYSLLRAFNHDRAEFATRTPVGKRWGLVHRNGEVLIPPLYHDLGGFRAGSNLGWCKMEGDKPFYLITSEGQVRYERNWVSVYSCFREGYLVVAEKRKDGRKVWGLINTEGEYVITPKWEALEQLSEGTLAACVKGKWGFIDLEERWVIEPRFSFAGRFIDGLAEVASYVHDQSGELAQKVGYIGQDGEYVIRPIYDGTFGFERGYANVMIEGEGMSRSGWIDTTGRELFPIS